MRLKFTKLLFTFCITASLCVISVQHSWSSGQYIVPCEVVVPGKRPIATTTIPQRDLDSVITELEKQGVSPGKARGEAGELFARQFIENDLLMNGHRYTSILTLFNRNGCDVSRAFEGTIDDIFVVVDANDSIMKDIKPIFHEAKYNVDGILKLGHTKSTCVQLSHTWNGIQLAKTNSNGKSDQSLLNAIYSDNFNRAVSCSMKLCTTLEWLRDKLRENFFLRTASVLDPTGRLQVYEVQENGKQYPLTLSRPYQGFLDWAYGLIFG